MGISLVGKDIWQFPLRHISEEEEERIRTEMERGEWAGGRFGPLQRKLGNYSQKGGLTNWHLREGAK